MEMLMDASSSSSHSLSSSAINFSSIDLTLLDRLLTRAVQFATVKDRVSLSVSKRWYGICTQPSCWSVSIQYDPWKMSEEMHANGTELDFGSASEEFQVSPVFKSTKILKISLGGSTNVQQMLDNYHKNGLQFEHLSLKFFHFPSSEFFDLRQLPLQSIKIQCNLVELPKMIQKFPTSVSALSLFFLIHQDIPEKFGPIDDDKLVDELVHACKHLQNLQVMAISFYDQVKSPEIHFHCIWFRTLNQLSKQNPKLDRVMWLSATTEFVPDTATHKSRFQLPVESYICPQIKAVRISEPPKRLSFPVSLIEVLFPNLDTLATVAISDQYIHERVESASAQNLRERPFPLPASAWHKLAELRVSKYSSLPFKLHPSVNLERLTTLVFEAPFSDETVQSFIRRTQNLTSLSFQRFRPESFEMFNSIPTLRNLEGIEWPKKYTRQVCEQLYGETVEEFNKRREELNTTDSHLDLAPYFPNLTSIQCNHQIPSFPHDMHSLPEHPTVLAARFHLQSIPNLTSVKWFTEGPGPILNPKDFDKYFSLEECLKRLQREREHACVNLDHGYNRDGSFEIDNGVRKGSFVSADTKYTFSYLHPRSFMAAASESGGVVPMDVDNQSDAAARLMTSFNLSLIFQFLPVTDLSQASRVSHTWRSASTSPLVLRHQISVKMDELMGAKVSGPCLRVSAVEPITRAVRSHVLRNIRILILGTHHTDHDQSIRRPLHSGESRFSASYLDVLESVPQFVSLHTLAIQWRHYIPTLSDVARVRNVLQSNALKHLKVLRLLGTSLHLQMLLDQIEVVTSLEIVELRYFPTEYDTKYRRFASQLLRLPKLKSVYISAQNQVARITTNEDLKELAAFCQGIPASFDELMWRIPLTEDVPSRIYQENKVGTSNLVFPYLKSIFIPVLSNDLYALARAAESFRDLSEISVGEFVKHAHPLLNGGGSSIPLPSHFVSQLQSFKIFAHNLNDALDLVECLEKYTFPALRCFHFIIRAYGARGGVNHRVDLAETFVETLSKFLNRQPVLEELNLAGHQRKIPRWSSIAQRLKVLNYSCEDSCLQCPNLVRLTIGSRVLRARLNAHLLTLPNFEELIISNGGENTVWSRMRLMRVEEQRKRREAEAIAAASNGVEKDEAARAVAGGKRKVAESDDSDEATNDFEQQRTPTNKRKT